MSTDGDAYVTLYKFYSTFDDSQHHSENCHLLFSKRNVSHFPLFNFYHSKPKASLLTVRNGRKNEWKKMLSQTLSSFLYLKWIPARIFKMMKYAQAYQIYVSIHESIEVYMHNQSQLISITICIEECTTSSYPLFLSTNPQTLTCQNKTILHATKPRWELVHFQYVISWNGSQQNFDRIKTEQIDVIFNSKRKT